MLSGNTLTATITQQSGSECGDAIGESFEFTVQLDGDTITVVEDLGALGTDTFVFKRV